MINLLGGLHPVYLTLVEVAVSLFSSKRIRLYLQAGLLAPGSL